MNRFIEPWGPSRFFGDDWFVSRQAAVLFFLGAVCVAFATPVFLGLGGATVYSWMGPARDFAGGLMAVGTLFLWLGMWRYWVRIDRSRPWMKRIGFFLLLIGFWYGSVIYYALFYIPQFVRRGRQEQ
jgi:hypothetical protein